MRTLTKTKIEQIQTCPHQWVPMGSIINFGGNKSDYQMLQGCVCGAYRWVPALRIEQDG